MAGKEIEADEWHDYWTPVYFESLKHVCFLRWENEIMQVVCGRMRLHTDCDTISTPSPRPRHFNVGLDEAPRVRGDKLRKSTLKCRGREFLRDRGNLIHAGPSGAPPGSPALDAPGRGPNPALGPS